MCDLPDSAVDDQMERDSLSSDSVSKDSLLTETRTKVRRKGSYTLESSPLMTQSVLGAPTKTTKDTRPADRVFLKGSNMAQSMYERPWQSSKTNSGIATKTAATARQREIRLRAARDEQARKQSVRLEGLHESERLAQTAARKREIERLRAAEEKRRKTEEKKKVVEERRQRLAKAEEARRRQLLQRLVGDKPAAPSGRMTMSCYGGIGRAPAATATNGSRRDRFLTTRPVSSTGKVMGFGSSTPRPICGAHDPATANETSSLRTRGPPQWLKERLELLARPNTARSTPRTTQQYGAMAVSVIHENAAAGPPRKLARQSSLRSTNSTTKKKATPQVNQMVTSMIDFRTISTPRHSGAVSSGSSITKPSEKYRSARTTLTVQSDYNSTTSDASPSVSMTHSRSFTRERPTGRGAARRKVDMHLDSDSIDEDRMVSVVPASTSPKQQQQSLAAAKAASRGGQQKIQSQPAAGGSKKSAQKPSGGRRPPGESAAAGTMTIADSGGGGSGGAAAAAAVVEAAEYKAKLMENRRLAREKREREREAQMRAERDRKLAEDLAREETAAAMAAAAADRDGGPGDSSEETQLTTSNDDVTVDPVDEADEEVTVSIRDRAQPSGDEANLSNIEKKMPPRLLVSPPPQVVPELLQSEQAAGSAKTAVDTETKRRLESIMSRFKRPPVGGEDAMTTSQTSSAVAMSNEEDRWSPSALQQRLAMSPEPSELDPPAEDTTPPQATSIGTAFRSSILQSMVNRGRLSATMGGGKFQDGEKSDASPDRSPSPVATSTSLGHQSLGENRTASGAVNSQSSCAIRASGTETNSLSDANSDFAIETVPQKQQPLSPSVAGVRDANDPDEAARGNCDGKEDSCSGPSGDQASLIGGSTDPVDPSQHQAISTNGRNYSSVSSIETEDDELADPSYRSPRGFNEVDASVIKEIPRLES